MTAPSIYERFFEFAPDAIVVTDSAGRICRVNAQAGTLFGYPPEEMVGQPIEILLPERYRERHVGHRAGYHAHPELRPMGAGFDLYGRRRDGSEFPVDILLSPLETEDGPMVIGVVRDITERRRIERVLQEKNVELANAVAAKDRFLASMSHELRTPLNAILGFAGTLLMKLPGPLNAVQETQLRTVRTSARHLLSLINDLLDITRIESGNVELRMVPVECAEVVREIAATLQPLADEKRLELKLDLPEEELVLATDRRALSQILLNLANNAVKFTEEGSVAIEVRRRGEGGASAVDFSVMDTGIGICPEDQRKLFTAFTQIDNASTRRYEGTGLGLYLSQKLALMIGGAITVESQRGTGSRFTLSLPLNSP